MNKKDASIELIHKIPENEMDLVLSFLQGITNTTTNNKQEPLESFLYHMGKTSHEIN